MEDYELEANKILMEKFTNGLMNINPKNHDLYISFINSGKMTGVFIAHQEMFGAFKYGLDLAMTVLCGATLEAEVYATVQDFRGSRGLISPELLDDNVYYNWKTLRNDAKTIGIIKDSMINDVDEIMKYRNLVHFGEKHFKDIINATSLTHKTLAKSGFNILKNREEAKALLEKTQDILVRILINYINAMSSSYLSYSDLRSKLWSER